MQKKRGGFRSGPRPGESRKTLSIPEVVPVGAVIGKGGSTCRGMRDKFNVFCRVDGDDRKITISGARNAVLEAESEFERMFREFSLQSKRVFEVVAQDGPSSLWRFEERASVLSEENVSGHRFQLVRAGGSELASNNLTESWIQPLHRYNMDNLMSYVDPNDPAYAARPRMEVVLGHLCFLLKTVDADDVLTWDELQRLELNVNYSSRWSNVCDAVSTPGVEKLVAELEEAAREAHTEWVNEISLMVLDMALQRTWQVKYILVDGIWKLRSQGAVKKTLGSYDILQTNNPSLRVRPLAPIKGSDQSSDGVQRYLSIRKSEDNDFWATAIELGVNAPPELEIIEFHVQSKTRVKWRGMLCRLAYQNEQHSEVRVKFRLTDETKASLDANENKCKVLVHKVLDLFSKRDEDAEDWERWVD